MRLARHCYRPGHDIGCFLQTLELTRRKPRPIVSPAQLEATKVPLSNAQGHRHRSRLIPPPLSERRSVCTRIPQKPLGQAMWIHDTDERRDVALQGRHQALEVAGVLESAVDESLELVAHRREK